MKIKHILLLLIAAISISLSAQSGLTDTIDYKGPRFKKSLPGDMVTFFSENTSELGYAGIVLISAGDTAWVYVDSTGRFRIQTDQAIIVDSLEYGDGTKQWSAAMVGGNDTEVQFNDGGSLGTHPEFLFTKADTTLATKKMKITELATSDVVGLSINSSGKITSLPTKYMYQITHDTVKTYILIVLDSIYNNTGLVYVNDSLYVTGTFHSEGDITYSGTLQAPGSNTYVLFNNNGDVSTDADFNFNVSLNELRTPNLEISGIIDSKGTNLNSVGDFDVDDNLMVRDDLIHGELSYAFKKTLKPIFEQVSGWGVGDSVSFNYAIPDDSEIMFNLNMVSNETSGTVANGGVSMRFGRVKRVNGISSKVYDSEIKTNSEGGFSKVYVNDATDVISFSYESATGNDTDILFELEIWVLDSTY